MQEAKDSSAIESIVTTHDELFQDELFPENRPNAAAKEVLRCEALFLARYIVKYGTRRRVTRHRFYR